MKNSLYVGALFLFLCTPVSLKAQTFCDRVPELLRLFKEKDFHKIAGEEYVDIFTESREYRPAVRFEGMIDERFSSAVRVFSAEEERPPILQYSFRIQGPISSELKELEKLRDRLLNCGLGSWNANTETDRKLGKPTISFSSNKYDETINLTLEKAFLDGFLRTDVYVLQIELNGWL